jgi:hypothetical protein
MALQLEDCNWELTDVFATAKTSCDKNGPTRRSLPGKAIMLARESKHQDEFFGGILRD